MAKQKSLGMFQECAIGDIHIIRVPNGYIYSRQFDFQTGKPAFGVFVPRYNKERKNKKINL